MMADPLAPLMALPGIAEASDQARLALGRAHRHRANLRGWPVTAAEAALRAARASAVLDGGSGNLDESASGEPIFAGALRVAQALEGGDTNLVSAWRRAPLQALARLHTLAATGLVSDEQLGRPRIDGEVGHRLALLAKLVLDGTQAPAPVVAAIAHGEILILRPFGSADGVVARSVSRLVTIASGLDPHGLGVPEVSWMRRAGEYRNAAQGLATGTPEGVAAWIVLCCRAMQAGAQEALSIADSLPKR
ncbi:MAG: oxidoreductase [Mycobacteriaceae bacterium]|nr:oxidoreductase [Mycobacteriaceae bacterium]